MKKFLGENVNNNTNFFFFLLFSGFSLHTSSLSYRVCCDITPDTNIIRNIKLL